MYSNKITALSGVLVQSPNSYNEIAQFLVMNTFRGESALCILFGEFIETGCVCMCGGFGWSPHEIAALVDIPINHKYPITDAIRENRVVAVFNDEGYLAEYPLMSEVNFSLPWITGVAIPCYPMGGFVLICSARVEITESMKLFFISIGSLIGLYASRLPTFLAERAIKAKEKFELPPTSLSERQLVIADMLEKGFNNAQIGLDLGYSESLIRQETVAIYRKLHVSGRKAMQVTSAIRLDQEAISGHDFSI